ncbi:acetoin utilization protein AcuC [Inquilinus sp. OTU3971]|uniref:acetoin utilization protein AcuC n=1 Tax=Inquilinus sp. OTU3971 TaxID=3043855 RepID=UPI00313BF827
MAARPILIGSEVYRRSSYGPKHPLAIPRVSTALDLIRAQGWLAGGQYREGPLAGAGALTRFHHPDYVAAVQDAERDQDLDPARRQRHNLGGIENPIFGEVFRRPATACGSSLLGAGLVAEGEVVYSPAGGLHHGRPDRASGFCYFNDPVLAILDLLDRGVDRIAYLDVDAHHGDGVQDAFAGDARVLTVSVHEAQRWPFTGKVDDRGGGNARNLAMPRELNDDEMAAVRDQALLPLVERFRPQVVVLQCGADALHDDPLSRLSLSNHALWDVVAAVRDIAPRLLVLGGGGYNPWTVGRCWAGVWAVLNGFDPAAPLTVASRTVLAGLSWSRRRGTPPEPAWFDRMDDLPRPGSVRPEVQAVIRAVMTP